MDENPTAPGWFRYRGGERYWDGQIWRTTSKVALTGQVPSWPPQLAPQLVDENMITTLPAFPGHTITTSYGIVTELSATSGWTATSNGDAALDAAMFSLRVTAKPTAAVDAIVGLTAAAFVAEGGITGVLGGDAVGILLTGTAVIVEPHNTAE